MKLIFEKNKINNKNIYDFKEIDGDKKFLDEICGEIYIGCLHEDEIEKTFNDPLMYVNENTIIGLFIRENALEKFHPISTYNGEIVAIRIEDGTDYTEEYNRLLNQIEFLQLEIKYTNNNEEEKEDLNKELKELESEKKALETPTIYNQFYIQDPFEDIKEEKKELVKKIGTVVSVGVMASIGIVKILRKIRK